MKYYFSLLFKTISFLLILLLLLSVGSHLFHPKDNRMESGMEEVAANGILGEKKDSIDVLFLGDSEAVSSISPMELWNKYGFTSYVCATSGQSLYTTYRFLVRAFQNQSPSVVVLETDALFQGISFQSCLLSEASIYLPIFQYHDRWKSLTLKDFTASITYTWTDDWKGYNSSTDIKAADAAGYMIPSDHIQEIEPLTTLYLRRIKKFCQSRSVSFLLVSTPSTKNWNYPRHNGVVQVAAKENLPYLDLNLITDTLAIDWNTDTRDEGDHLNDFGAKKVSLYLGEYLKKQYVLEDRRNDSAYQSWKLAPNGFIAGYQTMCVLFPY